MDELDGPARHRAVEAREVAAQRAAPPGRSGSVRAWSSARLGRTSRLSDESSVARTYRPDVTRDEHDAISGGPDVVRRARHPAARRHVRRRRPRDHRRLPRRRARHHRDRRGQGARRRGARRVPDPGRPGRADPAVHRGAHRHHRRAGRRVRRGSARRCPRSSSSRAAACWSPTTRRSTSASSRPRPLRTASRGRRSPSSTPCGWRAASLTRDEAPNCKLGTLARALPLDHHAQPPRARRRPRHRRRAARRCSSASGRSASRR